MNTNLNRVNDSLYLSWLCEDLPDGPMKRARDGILANMGKLSEVMIRKEIRGAMKMNKFDPQPETKKFAGHPDLADMIRHHIMHWREGLKMNRGGVRTEDQSFYDHELRTLDDIEKIVNTPQPSVQRIYMHDGDDIDLRRGEYNETHVIWSSNPNGKEPSTVRAVSGNAWKQAVDDELTQIQSTADSFASPKEAIAALIDWYVKAATDPALNIPTADIPRDPRDVASDPEGKLIHESSQPLRSAERYAAQYLPERDPALSAEEQGLFNKFIVRRVDKTDQIGGKHYGCRYFVLDVDHDPYAPFALTAYADACEGSHPELSAQMRRDLGALRRECGGNLVLSKGEVEMKATQLRWLLSLLDCMGPKEDANLVAQAGMLLSDLREQMRKAKKNVAVVTGLPEFTFIRMLVEELAAARAKHPDTDVTTIALFEEVGEVAKALLDERGDRVWKESIQTATMAMRVAIEGDKSVDNWRNRNNLGNHRQGYTEDPTIVTMRADMNGEIEG